MTVTCITDRSPGEQDRQGSQNRPQSIEACPADLGLGAMSVSGHFRTSTRAAAVSALPFDTCVAWTGGPGDLIADTPRLHRHVREVPKRKSRPYSITSSAWASSDGGTVSPSALAVLRLITISNFVGCTTGKLAGFSPLRTRPA